MMAASHVSFVLYIIWSIIVLCSGETIGYGWSQWFGNNGSTTDQLFTLKSPQNTSIIRVCISIQSSYSFVRGITAYFSDNYASTGGGGGKRLCLDALNQGQCFASIYVDYASAALEGLQLSTSDNIHFPYLGSRYGGFSSTVSAINLCLSGIQVYWDTDVISGIRFHFSATDDLVYQEYQTTEVTEQPVQISNKQQTSSTQVSSVTKQEQPVIINIKSQNNDSSASTIAFIVIFMIICICLFVICYKVWGNRYQGMRNMVEFASCCKNSTAVIDDNHIWLKQWLTDTVCLEQYYKHFVVNGYERKEFVKNIEKVSQLEAMCIVKQGHQNHILKEIQKLRSKHNCIDVIDLELQNDNGKKTNENAGHLYQGVENEIIVN
eukprot:76026_1